MQDDGRIIRLTFKLQINRDSGAEWNAVLCDGKLYVYIDPGNPAISKRGFLSVMEYAEDILDVDYVVVFFAKDNPARQQLVRTFMYIGFTMLPPGHQLIPPSQENIHHMYMAYTMV